VNSGMRHRSACRGRTTKVTVVTVTVTVTVTVAVTVKKKLKINCLLRGRY